MSATNAFSRKWLSLFSRKTKPFSIIVLIIIILILVSIIRACSNHSPINTIYRIGRSDKWSSLNLMGKERNVTAFSDELLQIIAKREKLNIQILASPPEGFINKLESGVLDGILSSLNPDFPLRATLAFSDSYFLLGPVLIVPLYSELDTREELSHKIIGVQTNSSTALELQKDSSIQIRLYDNILQALNDLDEHRIDGVIFPVLPAYTYLKTFYPDRFKIATTPLTDEGLRLITLKNPKGEYLVEHFNSGLKALKEDGTYEKLLAKWDLINIEKMEE